jgi:hypothetical protein
MEWGPCSACAAAGCDECDEGKVPVERGPPGLVVFDTCVDLIREVENYVRPDARGGKDGTEKPVKRDDHLLDALRYMVTGLRLWF